MDLSTRVSTGDIHSELTKGVKILSRKFIALAGFMLALALPSVALANDGKPWSGHKPGDLSSNIQSSIQSAHRFAVGLERRWERHLDWR